MIESFSNEEFQNICTLTGTIFVARATGVSVSCILSDGDNIECTPLSQDGQNPGDRGFFDLKEDFQEARNILALSKNKI